MWVQTIEKETPEDVFLFLSSLQAWLMLSFIAKDDIDYVQSVTSGSEWTDY